MQFIHYRPILFLFRIGISCTALIDTQFRQGVDLELLSIIYKKIYIYFCENAQQMKRPKSTAAAEKMPLVSVQHQTPACCVTNTCMLNATQ